MLTLLRSTPRANRGRSRLCDSSAAARDGSAPGKRSRIVTTQRGAEKLSADDILGEDVLMTDDGDDRLS